MTENAAPINPTPSDVPPTSAPQETEVAQVPDRVPGAGWVNDRIEDMRRAQDAFGEWVANQGDRLTNRASRAISDQPPTAEFPLRVAFGTDDPNRPNVPVTDVRLVASPGERNDPDPQFGFAIPGRDDLQINGNVIENVTLVPTNATATRVLNFLQEELGDRSLDGFSARYGIEANPRGTGEQPALYVQGSGIRLDLAVRAAAREEGISVEEAGQRFVQGLALEREDLIQQRDFSRRPPEEAPQQSAASRPDEDGGGAGRPYAEELVALGRELPQTPEVQRLVAQAERAAHDIRATVPEAERHEPALPRGAAPDAPTSAPVQEPPQEQASAGPQLA